MDVIYADELVALNALIDYLLLLLAAQIFFYLDNTRIFHIADVKEWLGILWGNITFGIATIGCLLLPYFVANLLPFKFRWPDA